MAPRWSVTVRRFLEQRVHGVKCVHRDCARVGGHYDPGPSDVPWRSGRHEMRCVGVHGHAHAMKLFHS